VSPGGWGGEARLGAARHGRGGQLGASHPALAATCRRLLAGRCLRAPAGTAVLSTGDRCAQPLPRLLDFALGVHPTHPGGPFYRLARVEVKSIRSSRIRWVW
jgi:hypothetical protein